MAIPTLNCIELFSGVGMLGEGLRAGLDYLGFAYRTLCHIEREAYAASVLVARMEEKSMDAAPVWSDVCTFDARAWRGKVDCVVAGFPCQDLSVAGRRAGLDGARSGLFFQVTRIAEDCGAWCIVLENVAGIATATATVMDEEEGELEERAVARVLGELADLGWDAEWITLSASDVGASHGRARWFCVAWRMANSECSSGIERSELEMQRRWTDQAKQIGIGCGGIGKELGDTDQQREQQPGKQIESISREWSRTCSCGTSRELGNSTSDGRREGRPESIGQQGRSDAAECCVPVADAGGAAIRRDCRAAPCAQSEDGRRIADDDHGTECVCRGVADAGQPGQQRCELGRTRDGNRGGGESTWIN